MKDIEVKISRETRNIIEISNSVIGNDGENLQGNIVFSFDDEFVNGQARLETVINGVKAYQILTKEEDVYKIPIKSVLTKYGLLKLQLVITEGTDVEEIPIFKSDTFELEVDESINAEIEQPEEYPTWIEIANTKLNAIDEKIEEVDTAVNAVNNAVERVDEGLSDLTRANEDAREIVNDFEDNVEGYTNDFNTNANNKTSTFNSNYESKLSSFNGNATEKTTEYNNNADSKSSSYNSNASSKLSEYNTNAETKKSDYDTNASSKLNAYNTNAEAKLSEYNTNAITKIEEYNQNASDKIDEYDEHVSEMQDIINNLKDDVDDLRDNQIISEQLTGTNINITNAAKARIYDFELNKLSTQETSILPSGYTQVDYIESSGTQYIDTGVKLQPDLFFDITLQHDNLGGMYGRYTNNNRVISQVYTDVINKLSFQYGNSSTSMNYILQNNLYDKYNIKVKDYKMYLNEVQVAENSNAILENSEDDFYLFRQSAIYGKGKIFYAKLYIGNTLVRDFIPCYRNSDNEVGLYDLVNDVFYANQGTDDFTYGKVVTIPNPNYPQEIKMISGSVDVYVSNGETTNTYTINLGNNEICGIGNYKDELLVDKNGKCWLNKKTRKISLAISDMNNNENYPGWINVPNLRNDFPNVTGASLANYADYLSNIERITNTGIKINTAYGNSILYLQKELFDNRTQTDWKTEFPNLIFEVVYNLPTPELIDLNTTINIKLFKGLNIITNNETANMKIKYVESIDSLVARVEALEQLNQ